MAIEIVSRISKGSKMDQIYLPKNRIGFHIGNYVLIKPIEEQASIKQEEQQTKPYFYGLKTLEPIKLLIVKEILALSQKFLQNPSNIIITGSFLEKGFAFNDIDLLIITEKSQNTERFAEKIEEISGISCHAINLSQKELAEGISSDPLYENMLSRCISKNRLVFNIKRKINPKILDFHLLKSKAMLGGFDFLNGKEKYYLSKNLIAIFLFIQGQKVSNELLDSKIKETLRIEPKKLKENIIDKKSFVSKYKTLYDKTFSLIMEQLKNEPKQK
jgi:hypothetical protein